MIGKTLAHYRIVEKIGAGGMGEVYRARDEHLGRDVALKVLPTGTLADEHARKRFRKEAQALSKLNHPNIATVFDFDTQDGTDFLVMELVEGMTLSDKLAGGPLPEKEITRLGMQLAEALEEAHERGVVHRDLKPGNVMVTPKGQAKILDFGLAKLLRPVSETATTESFTETQGVAGTLPYMAPEQLRGSAPDHRSDIYSFGVVLYEMATGQRPFQERLATALANDIINKPPPPPGRLRPDLSSRLEETILKALEKEPEDRYQSAKEIAVDLRRLKRDTDSGRAAVAGAAGVAAPTKKRWRVLASVAALVALVIGGAAWFQFFRAPSKSALQPMRVVPLTSFPGTEADPALSPDGSYVAFDWNGETGDNFDLYVKLIGTETTLRLTDNPAEDCCPAWSPDGRYIAFMRSSGTKDEIFIIPALGGPERKLQTISGARPSGRLRFVSWSPDGRLLAFADQGPDEGPYAIFLVSVESLERRKLSAPPAEYQGDSYPVFSPDGKTLAFVRAASAVVSDIYLLSVAGGEPRRLTFDNVHIHGLGWIPDGREIVFSSHRGGGFSETLWRISASGGAPERLALGGENASNPSISGQGHRLAYVQGVFDSNIWRIDVQGSTGGNRSPAKLIASTRFEGGPQFSPDGKKITFCSGRSGNNEIWICDSDGSNCLQLTSFQGPHTCTPRWAPDGRRIAFDSRPEGHGDIYVIDLEYRVPRRLTIESSSDVVPSWSNDGRWIYFASNRSGNWQVWKAPTEGGPAVQVTQNGGFAAFESPDGQFVYYAKFNEPGIWRVPVLGGEETLVLDLLQPGLWGYWAVVDEGIYFLNAEAEPRPAIEFYRFATRRATRVTVPEKDPDYGDPGMAVSPDGRWILYAQVDQETSDIMLVENFR
jgi:Tol biopolymer transport system component/predicted Ser/Thr protein kinase